MDQDQKTIKYFGHGTNKDREMMSAIIGRQDLVGEPGQLIGYELCIQKIDDIPTTARNMLKKVFVSDFELFIVRPNPNAVTYGTIWDLTPLEYEMTRDWELVEFGMQQDIKAKASDARGNIVEVLTQGWAKPDVPIDRVVSEENYEPYLVPKEEILKVANKVHQDFIERTT